MNGFRRVLCILLLTPSVAMAAENTLREIGPLILTGRGAEVRPQLVKIRDEFAADGMEAEEAATWLLLGLLDHSIKDQKSALSELNTASGKLTALGDQLGAWMSLMAIATIKADDALPDEAAAVYKRIFDQLSVAEGPAEKFSIGSVLTLGEAFGANTAMLGPLASHPEVLKPVILGLAQAASHDGFAGLLIENDDLAGAEEELRQASAASAIFPALMDGGIDLHYALLRQKQWRLDEAREHYMKSLNHAQTVSPIFMPPAIASDPWVELRVLRNLAELELLRGRLDDALTWNDRALKLVRAGKDPVREAKVLRNRASLLENGGRYDAALATFDSAMKLAVEAKSVSVQADLHTDLGMAHLMRGTYGTAATHLEKSVALYRSLNEPYVEAPIWIILAEVYTLLESDSNAAQALDNARTLAEKSGFTAVLAIADAITAARSVMRAGGTPTDLAATMRGLLSISATQPSMLPPAWAALLTDPSSISGPAARPTSTIEQGGQPIFNAYRLMTQGRLAMDRHEYENARRLFNEVLVLNQSRELRAGVFASIGASYWAEGHGEEAIRHFRKAADTLEAAASDVKVEELLSSFLGSNRRWYFDLLIEMLVHEGHPMEAFAQAERARSRTFLQLVGNHRFNGAASADPALVAEAENVRAIIADREKVLMSAKPEETARLAAELARARDYYRTIVIRMKATNPEYADVTTVAPQALDTIGPDLPADTTLVSYYVSAHAVHAWIIDREAVHYELLRLDAAALKPLTCWAEALGSNAARGVEVRAGGCSTNSGTAEDAYRALFAPLRKHIKHQELLIVPHGVLHYIPFAALRDPETSRYLVQDFTLTFTPSASATRFLHAKESAVDGEALVIGDPLSPLPNLGALPGAKEEATFVARALGTAPHLGADGRETLLYGLKGKYDLIHIAAHAIYDPADPLFSRIALAADEQQDGSLTVNEILSSVDLKGVNLVVLSACRSAVGQRSGGDEIVGLTRALLYAGTPGVISTLWNINDTAAAGLMKDFYVQLGAGASAADALRHAQLAAIDSKELSDPRYWAAFMLTGDPHGRWKAAAAADTK